MFSLMHVIAAARVATMLVPGKGESTTEAMSAAELLAGEAGWIVVGGRQFNRCPTQREISWAEGDGAHFSLSVCRHIARDGDIARNPTSITGLP